MPRNRVGRQNIITSSRWHAEDDFRNDSDSSNSSTSSSDSDISSSSSNRSCVSVAARSSHSDNSDISVGSGDGNHSVNSNESHSDNSDADNNQSDSESSASSISVQSNNSGSNPVASDNNSNSSGSDESQINISDENNSNLSIASFDGSFGSGGRIQSNQNIYDSDDSSSYRPLRLPLPGTPSPSGSDRSFGSARSQSPNSESGIIFRLQNLQRSLRRPPTPNNYSIGVHPVQRDTEIRENTTEPRIMTGSSSGSSSITYECSVCLENLDTPASIDNPPSHDDNNGSTQGNETAGTSRGNNRGRPSGGSRNAQRTNGHISPTDVVATHCGHLYHQVCLEKWFREQGRRTCPSCRKAVPKSKQIRLYPNISVETGGRNDNGTSPSLNMPGPSSGIMVVNVEPTTEPPPQQETEQSNENRGECKRLDCQDLRVIHNTLINDFNELQERFHDVRENDELKEAQIRSLEEDNARQFDEISRLKRQMHDHAGSSPIIASASKRRRQ